MAARASRAEIRQRAVLADFFHSFAPDHARDWAERLTRRFDHLGSILAASPEAIASATGDRRSAQALISARALLAESLRANVAGRTQLGTGAALRTYLTFQMGTRANEELRVLFLDARNGLIRDETLQVGAVNEVPIYPREIIRRALELGATALIVAHNHPSGDATPSDADVEQTRALMSAADAMGITVHDHVVISHSGWSSMRAMELI